MESKLLACGGRPESVKCPYPSAVFLTGDEPWLSSRRFLTLFWMDVARDTPPMLFGAVLEPRSARCFRYSAAALATRFSSIERRLRSISRLCSGGRLSMSSRRLPSSLRPSVASDPAIGVRSRRSISCSGLGVLGGGGVFALSSKRLKASPNLPANKFLVPDKVMDGKLERFDFWLLLLRR